MAGNKSKKDWFTVASGTGVVHGAMAGWNHQTDPAIQIKTGCGKTIKQAPRGIGSVNLLTCIPCRKAFTQAGYH